MSDRDGHTFKQRAMQQVRHRAPMLGRHTLRWIWFYLAILLGYMAQENYFPFSDWPMYSNFAKRATYVYAIDGHGNEIAWRTTFGQTSAPIKRQYERERTRIQREQGVDREEANVIGGAVLMERLALRLSADELEQMGDSLTIHYMGVAFNEKHEMEHQHKATSVIELGPIIAAKRAEEAGDAQQQAPEGDEEDESRDDYEESSDDIADDPESAFGTDSLQGILSFKEVPA